MRELLFLVSKAGDRDQPAVASWSLIPILCLVFGAISMVGLFYLVKFLNKRQDKKIINIIIFCYGLAFLGMEVYHQINRYFMLGFYDWSSFPFQFCSIPIYFCLILPFIKNEKVREPIFYYFAIYNLISGVFPLLFGQGNLCRWNTVADTIRSFVWHILIVQLAIISFTHKNVAYDLKKTYKPLIGAICIFISLTVIAQLINVTLHYTGGIYFGTTDGSAIKDVTNTTLRDPDSASCFYISPFFVSNMPVYSTIWIKFGWLTNYILYILSFSLLAVIIYFVTYEIKALIAKFKNKSFKNAEIAG